MEVSTVTKLLEEGTPAALDRLFPVVYDQLVGVAKWHRGKWQGNATLNTTALVHEAYLKLAGGANLPSSHAHFLAVASKAMRQILVNYAQRQSAVKRGGESAHIGLDTLMREGIDVQFDMTEARMLSIIQLDRALEKLAAERSDLAQVIECRVFGQMTAPETALALGISESTVTRRTRLAESWLFRELS